MHLNLRPPLCLSDGDTPVLRFQVLAVEVCETTVPTVDITVPHLLRTDATYASTEEAFTGTSTERARAACEVCVFGVSAAGHSLTIRVTGFMPHFFVEVTPVITTELVLQCAQELRARFRLRTSDIIVQFVQAKRMYGWVPDERDPTTVRKFTFAKICLPNSYMLRLAERQLTERTLTCLKKTEAVPDVSEGRVAISEKFLAAHGIKASGWVTIAPGAYSVVPTARRATVSQLEVRCGVGAITPLDRESIAPLVIAAVDIEAHSHDYRSFPTATHPDDAVTFIGTTFWVYGDTCPRERVMLVLGSCEVPPDSGVRVVSYATEYELLVGWRDLMALDGNPDMVVSYNGTGFDYAYLAARLNVLRHGPSRFNHLGRLLMVPGCLRTRELTSAAKGQNIISWFPLPGRVQMDLFMYVRDSQKLSSYKLDDVCDQFLPNAHKVVLDHPGWVRSCLDTAVRALASVAEKYHVSTWDTCAAALRDVQATCTETDVGGAYRAVHAAVTSAVATVTRNIPVADQAEVRALMDTAVQPVLDAAGDNNYRKLFRMYEQGAHARGAIAVYCQVDCDLVVLLLERLNVVANTIQMSQVCNTLADDVCNRGQQIKTYNLISRFASARQYILNVRDSGWDATATYEGATVLEPTLGYYEVPVVTLDFASLYPSLMRAYNLCHSSLVLDEAYKAIPGIKYGRYDIGGKTWTFQETTPGVLPEILKSLLDARKGMKKKMKTFPKHSFEYRLCDGAQLALKISCNSVYGFTGVTTNGMYACMPVAVATTYNGRQAITNTRAFIEQQYGATVVYGDTDSVMVTFPGVTTVADAFTSAARAAREATAMFPDAIVLEFEKVFFPYLLVKKKTYAGMKYEDDPGVPPVLDVKGLAVVRRDNCELVRDVMRAVLHKIMQERDAPGAYTVVHDAVTSLLHGNVPLAKLQISNSLRTIESYTNTCQPQLTVVRKMTERRAFDIPRSGDRVPYVIIKDTRLPRVSDRAEHPLYAEEHGLPIDTEYYLVNQLQNRLDVIVKLLPVPNIERLFADAVACARDSGVDRAMIDAICTTVSRPASQLDGLKPRVTKQGRAPGWDTNGVVKKRGRGWKPDTNPPLTLFDMLKPNKVV